MSASVRDEAAFGPQALGLRWQAPGMSFLVFADDSHDLVCREVDYHDGGSRSRSIHAALATRGAR